LGFQFYFPLKMGINRR